MTGWRITGGPNFAGWVMLAMVAIISYTRRSLWPIIILLGICGVSFVIAWIGQWLLHRATKSAPR